MKYNIALIALILILIIGHVFYSFYTLFLGILTVGLVFLTVFLWEFSIFKQDFYFDKKFRSQRKTIDFYNILIAIIWTLIYTTQDSVSEFEILMIVCFWSLPFTDLLMWLIYKAKKPYTIFIKDDKLIINKRWLQTRYLPNLVKISYNRITKNLSLDFKIKSEVTINTMEYSVDDIESILQILIEKSNHKVFIPDNYILNSVSQSKK